MGEFVIRGCQSSPGEFSISVRWEKNESKFPKGVRLDADDKEKNKTPLTRVTMCKVLLQPASGGRWRRVGFVSGDLLLLPGLHTAMTLQADVV